MPSATCPSSMARCTIIDLPMSAITDTKLSAPFTDVLHSVLHALRLFRGNHADHPSSPQNSERLSGAVLRLEKRSESALVRDLIEREIERGFDFNRVRHLVGSIASSPKHWAKDPWRKHIRQRNWRR